MIQGSLQFIQNFDLTNVRVVLNVHILKSEHLLVRISLNYL